MNNLSSVLLKGHLLIDEKVRGCSIPPDRPASPAKSRNAPKLQAGSECMYCDSFTLIRAPPGVMSGSGDSGLSTKSSVVLWRWKLLMLCSGLSDGIAERCISRTVDPAARMTAVN